MNWFIYPVALIDYNWSFCKTVNDTLTLISNNINREKHYQYPTSDDFVRDWENAQLLAKENGWSGNFAESPIVFWYPNQNIFDYGFAFQDASEDGATFVISPVEMPWFDD